jgi:selenide,water dikinase
VVRHLNSAHPDQLLVGPDTGDDAAVWKLDDERALVSTADFITPVVDDARTWGRVAAANSVSDIYAMGGRPLFALNLVGWNTDALPTALLGEVLAGGQDIATEAGFVIAGGHTIDDPEPKYGMAVTGEAHPDRLLTNAGLRTGQDIVLTKALGVGVLTTAIKNARATVEQTDAAVASMVRLNGAASQLALAAGVTGCTDVTGFGLLGHLGRMAIESAVSVSIEFSAVPFLPGAVELAADGVMPGGSRRNLAWALEFVDVGGHDEVHQLLLADAQTSGGLVFGVDPSETAGVLAELIATGHDAAHIGTTAEAGTSSTGRPGLTLR